MAPRDRAAASSVNYARRVYIRRILSQNPNDKAIVRHLAQRVRSDGLKVWAQLEAGKFRAETTRALIAARLTESELYATIQGSELADESVL